MSSDDFGAQGSNLMSSDDDDDLEPWNNPATPITPTIMHDLEVVLYAATDEGDGSSMASECAEHFLGAKPNMDINRPRSRRILLD